MEYNEGMRETVAKSGRGVPDTGFSFRRHHGFPIDRYKDTNSAYCYTKTQMITFF